MFSHKNKKEKKEMKKGGGRKERKKHIIQRGRKVKLVFSDDMIMYVESTHTKVLE